MVSTTGLFSYRPLRYYLNATLCYGFIRSVTYDYDGTRSYYQRSTGIYEKKEKLLADKIGSVFTGTLAAPTAWPWMMSRDLMRWECFVRGKNIAEYSE